MKQQLSRRGFLRVAGFTSFTFALGGLAGSVIGQASKKPIYMFPVLGDLHYDKWEHHDLDWVKREKAGDLRQIEGYVKTTEQFTPRLLAAVAEAVKSAEAPVPFVLQLGDVVEGLCGSYDLQALQFKDCFKAIAAAKLGVPVYLTKGNHDVTGPGAPEAFDRVLLPWLSEQAGRELASANYAVSHADDQFVFFDGYKPDLNWLEKTLEQGKALRRFFVVHQPVVPYNARAHWTVFGHERQQADRERLVNLLARHDVIALTGHLHKYSLLRQVTADGRITQLAISSVVRNEVERARDELEGVEAFNEKLVDLEPRFSPDTLDRRRKILAETQKGIQQFEYADVPGFAMVRVYADRVETEVFEGLSRTPWKQRPLRDPAKV